jgi:hypothetical protein
MAQTSRFVYQVTMKSDSTDKTNITIENAILDVSPEKSIFYGEGSEKEILSCRECEKLEILIEMLCKTSF